MIEVPCLPERISALTNSARKREDLEVAAALGMTGTVQATVLRHGVIPSAGNGWCWAMELPCVTWLGMELLAQKDQKNPSVGSLFHAELHYCRWAHPQNHGKERRWCLQAAPSPLFSCRAMDITKQRSKLKGKTLKVGSQSGQHQPRNLFSQPLYSAAGRCELPAQNLSVSTDCRGGQANPDSPG